MKISLSIAGVILILASNAGANTAICPAETPSHLGTNPCTGQYECKYNVAGTKGPSTKICVCIWGKFQCNNPVNISSSADNDRPIASNGSTSKGSSSDNTGSKGSSSKGSSGDSAASTGSASKGSSSDNTGSKGSSSKGLSDNSTASTGSTSIGSSGDHTGSKGSSSKGSSGDSTITTGPTSIRSSGDNTGSSKWTSSKGLSGDSTATTGSISTGSSGDKAGSSKWTSSKRSSGDNTGSKPILPVAPIAPAAVKDHSLPSPGKDTSSATLAPLTIPFCPEYLPGFMDTACSGKAKCNYHVHNDFEKQGVLTCVYTDGYLACDDPFDQGHGNDKFAPNLLNPVYPAPVISLPDIPVAVAPSKIPSVVPLPSNGILPSTSYGSSSKGSSGDTTASKGTFSKESSGGTTASKGFSSKGSSGDTTTGTASKDTIPVIPAPVIRIPATIPISVTTAPKQAKIASGSASGDKKKGTKDVAKTVTAAPTRATTKTPILGANSNSCPISKPVGGAPCSFTSIKCKYGEVTCCAQTGPLTICEANRGYWSCYNTNFCSMINCTN